MKRYKAKATAPKNNNFLNNSLVEGLVTEYVKGGCVDVQLRNRIMEHVPQFLKGVIKTFKFHQVLTIKDPHITEELTQVAWKQIEKTLYKFDYSDGHSKLFSQWTQVAKQCILAELKVKAKDISGYNGLKKHMLAGRSTLKPIDWQRFITEARDIFQYDDESIQIINHLEHLILNDDNLYDCLIGKLAKSTRLTRTRIVRFLKELRLMGGEFSDSPLNRDREEIAEDSGPEKPEHD